MSTKDLSKFHGWYKRPVLTKKQERHLRRLLTEAYGHTSGRRRVILTNTAGGLLQKNQKTHISIPYTPLSKYIHEIMRNNHYKREVVIALLKELGMEGERPVETFLYGGCWHGEDPERVDRLFETKVDYAFFSDITGSSRIEESKRLFYNEVVNTGSYLFRTGELESLEVGDERKEIRLMKLRLKRSFLKLMRWRGELENRNYKLQDKEILENIRVLVDRRHPYYIKNHGKWMATFTKEAREKILRMISEDTVAFIQILGKLRKRGTRVIIVEGNWDSDSTFDIIAKGILPEIEKIKINFSTKEYLDRHHFEFYTTIEGIDTQTSYHIVVPFFWLLNMDKILREKKSQIKMAKILDLSKKAKAKGRTIVFYAHGVPYPEFHDLSSLDIVSEDNELVAKNLRLLMSILRPYEVIYPHYHTPRIDKRNIEIPANFDMLVDSSKKGAPLVKNRYHFSGNKDNLTYLDFVPFRDVAIKKIFKTFSLPAKII